MHKNYLWYQYFRYCLVKPGLHLFYKKITVEGREKLPHKKPILFVPNHQNSFMDALLVVTHSKSMIYFLTQAGVFKNPTLALFLKSLNMLPVYRVRDGLSSVNKNNEIFDRCVEYLGKGDAVLVFAEASHDLKRRLRPFSKGFTRIAFEAELNTNWGMDLHVVPVGLNYSDHTKGGSEVRIVFGKPIKVTDYKQLFEEDEHKAANALKEDVWDELSSLIMHVPDLENYPLYKIVLVDLEADRSALTNPSYINSKVKKLEARMSPDLCEKAKNTLEMAKKYKFSLRPFSGKKVFTPGRFLLLPFYLFAWLNNIIPYQPIRTIIKSLIRDPAFDASIRFLFTLFIYLFFYLIIFLVLTVSGISVKFCILYLIVSMATFRFFHPVLDMYNAIKDKRWLRKFENSHPTEYQSLVNSMNEFVRLRRDLLTQE